MEQAVETPLPESLSHAYLITGGSGESRRAYAQRLTAAYQCTGERPPCGRCLACEKVSKGIHPDVVTLSPPEGRREIPVGDARAMRAQVYIIPNEGRRKVFLIDPADALKVAAQNALLKVLEDGPAYAAFLLLCEQPGKLLDTVRSRCETINLPPEEPEPDPELARRGEALAQLLLQGDEWALARGLTALELEKGKGADALALLAAAEEAVRARLGHSRRAVPVLRALRSCRQAAPFNPAPGHLYGWLCAELFR